MKLFRILILVFVLPFGLANAGQQDGLVEIEHGSYDARSTTAGYTFFRLTGGSRTGNPCTQDRWVFDNDWPAAKFQVATLLTAIATGKRVLVRGTGSCLVWSDTETAFSISIID